MSFNEIIFYHFFLGKTKTKGIENGHFLNWETQVTLNLSKKKK